MFVVPLIVVALGAAFGAVGYLLQTALGIPNRFQMPWVVRFGGVVALGLGLGVLGWLSKYRKLGDRDQEFWHDFPGANDYSPLSSRRICVGERVLAWNRA